MAQKTLQKEKAIMGAAERCVSEASTWAMACVAWEKARGSEDPLATVARRARVTRNTIWSLMYRPPKRVAADVYLAVGELYERECAKQSEKYAEERARTQAKTKFGRLLVGAADALVRTNMGEE